MGYNIVVEAMCALSGPLLAALGIAVPGTVYLGTIYCAYKSCQHNSQKSFRKIFADFVYFHNQSEYNESNETPRTSPRYV